MNLEGMPEPKHPIGLSDRINNSANREASHFKSQSMWAIRMVVRRAHVTSAHGLKAAQNGGEMPLDYFLRVDPSVPAKRRDEMAKASPFLHARLPLSSNMAPPTCHPC